MKIRFVLCLAVAVMISAEVASAQAPSAGSAAAAAPAPKVAWTKQVRRAPESYLQLSDVAGVHQTLLDYLGIKEGDPVVIKAGEKSIAIETKVHTGDASTVLLKESLRKSLGIEEGAVALQLSPAGWSTGEPSKAPVKITKVSKPTEAFVTNNKNAIGLSYRDMMTLGAKPGMRAVVVNGDKKSVGIVFLQDRGQGTALMGKPRRDRLGIVDGPVDLTIQIVPGAAPAGEAEPEG